MAKEIILHNVRIAFCNPDLWVPQQFDGQGDPRYSSTLIVEPDSDNDKKINDAIQYVAKDKWKDKAAQHLKAYEGNSNKFCYLDGDKKANIAGYAGHWILSATRPQASGKPLVIDRSKNPVGLSDGVIYGGCYVNAKVEIWAQDGKYPGIRCGLQTIQFFKKGDSFGGAGAATDDGFDDLGFEEDDDLV